MGLNGKIDCEFGVRQVLALDSEDSFDSFLLLNSTVGELVFVGRLVGIGLVGFVDLIKELSECSPHKGRILGGQKVPPKLSEKKNRNITINRILNYVTL